MREGWGIRKLVEIASFVGDGDWIESKDQSSEGIRLIQTGNIGDGLYKDKGERAKYISTETFHRLHCTEIFAGACLVSRLPDPIGRACILPKLEERTITAVDCSIIRFKKNILPQLFVYFSKSSRYHTYINTNATGTTRKRISRKRLEQAPIPVPPVQEQEKIVAELDCLSGIIEKKKQQLKELDNLAQSIFYDMFGGIRHNVPLSHYAESLRSGKSLAGEEECCNKVLKTGAVSYDYFRGEDIKNLPADYIPLPEHQVQPKDILVSRMNTLELVGATAYVWDVADNIYLPDRLWKVGLRDNANPVFIWKALVQPQAKEFIRKNAGGTSGSMKNISKPVFLRTSVPFVDLTTQAVFAHKIEAIEKQKELIKKSIQETETLFNSRMDYWFN